MMTQKLQPVRFVSDIINAGSGGSNFAVWGSNSYRQRAQGIIVQSIIGTDGSAPSTVWIGFNKQPPALFNVRDAFKVEEEFFSVEIYNNSTVNWTIAANIFDGDYRPQANSVVNNSTGAITTNISSQASLAATATLGVYTSGSIIAYVDSTSQQLVAWQFRADAAGTGAIGKVVPSDWNAVTNAFSWYECL
jgi:hypothetical protein